MRKLIKFLFFKFTIIIWFDLSKHHSVYRVIATTKTLKQLTHHSCFKGSIPSILAVFPILGQNKLMNINVASIANAKVIYLYFHLTTCQTVVNSGTNLKQL